MRYQFLSLFIVAFKPIHGRKTVTAMVPTWPHFTRRACHQQNFIIGAKSANLCHVQNPSNQSPMMGFNGDDDDGYGDNFGAGRV